MDDYSGAVTLSLDFEQFRKSCDIEEFYAKLEDKPKIALSCISVAVHQVLLWTNDEKSDVKVSLFVHYFKQ